MKIIKMNPQGFCHGVIRAIKQIEEILDIDTYEKPLYMYGSLVHNKHVVKHFNDRGIINIDSINNINHGTIIITAHGLSKIKQQEMINKGLNIIDATCTEVKKTHEYIEQKINDGYDVIYYGKKNHAECMAVLENFVHKSNNNVIF